MHWNNLLEILSAILAWLEKRGRSAEQQKTQAKSDEIVISPRRSFLDKFVRGNDPKDN